MEKDRRNILKVGHCVNSVNRNFLLSIEQVCIGQAVNSNDGGRVRETGNGRGLSSVGIVKGLKVLVANVRDLKSGMKYEELQLLAE